MRLLEAALAGPNCVVSVMGDHAGEGADEIFNRKKADINRLGKTFWLMRSSKARPAQVQGMCATIPAYTIFVEPATKGGARPTTAEDAAKEYSDDRVLWHRLPEGLSPVTGKLDAGATALVFDMMTTDVSGTLDLWEYGELSETPKRKGVQTCRKPTFRALIFIMRFTGSGFPLILIRGLASNADHWYCQVPTFSSHYSVLH